MTPLPMLALVRATNGATILIPADMIGTVEEIIGGVKLVGGLSPPRARVTLRDHTYYDVEESIEEILGHYEGVLAEHLSHGKDAT